MSSAHAKYSPSSAHRWIACPGSMALSEGIPNRSSKYAEEGTAAHELAAWALIDGRDTQAYIGRRTANGWEVTVEMAGYVQGFVDEIREAVDKHKLAGATEVELHVEVRVDFEHYLGQPNSFGTSDIIIIAHYPSGNVIEVRDLKYGQGEAVYAEANPQLLIYASGALAAFELAYEFSTVVLAIHMPRLGYVSEWETTPEYVRDFMRTARSAATMAESLNRKTAKDKLNPGEKQCRWCPAKALCPALRGFVADTCQVDFDDLTSAEPDVKEQAQHSDMETLENNLARVDLIEQWCLAQRAEMERRLFAGEKSTMYKLVQGRKGSRAWKDKDEAEKLLKNAGLKDADIYSFSLITPPTAEKALKSSNALLWNELCSLITQSEGKPTVVLSTDKRPAIEVSNIEVDFEDLSDED